MPAIFAACRMRNTLVPEIPPDPNFRQGLRNRGIYGPSVHRLYKLYLHKPCTNVRSPSSGGRTMANQMEQKVRDELGRARTRELMIRTARRVVSDHESEDA